MRTDIIAENGRTAGETRKVLRMEKAPASESDRYQGRGVKLACGKQAAAT
jgi:hypothetical protein